MKLSNEAMRDILMFLEKDLTYEIDKHGYKIKKSYTPYQIINNTYFNDLFKKHKYTKDELEYSIDKMVEAELLLYIGSIDSYYSINDISYEGHQLLKNIKNENIWAKQRKNFQLWPMFLCLLFQK